jgi:hypothetical protein
MVRGIEHIGTTMQQHLPPFSQPFLTIVIVEKFQPTFHTTQKANALFIALLNLGIVLVVFDLQLMEINGLQRVGPTLLVLLQLVFQLVDLHSQCGIFLPNFGHHGFLAERKHTHIDTALKNSDTSPPPTHAMNRRLTHTPPTPQNGHTFLATVSSK